MRFYERMKRHRIVSLAAITITFALALAVVDVPGVERVIPQLNTDSAVAGKQYKYKCQLPYGIESSIAGDWGYSTWQPSRTLAKLSAISDATDGRYRVSGPNWVDGTFTLSDHRGREVYTIYPSCSLRSTRWKSTR